MASINSVAGLLARLNGNNHLALFRDLGREIADRAGCKLVVVGTGGVGKTSFLRAFRGLAFDARYHATVGVEASTIEVETTKGPVYFELADMAGQERFGDRSHHCL